VKYILTNILLICFSISLHAQNVINDVDSSNSDVSLSNNVSSDIITEKIFKISNSKRIFVITNSNSYIARGDYVTFLTNGKPVARGLTAKTDASYCAIKMLKIYSLTRWNRLAENIDVQIIKGDDSFLRNKPSDNTPDKFSKIASEDDLYNDTVLEADVVNNESSKKVIKNDNLLSFGYGWINGVDNTGQAASFGMLNGAWAYQLHENVFGELNLARTIINDFPSEELDTELTSIIARIKYAFNTPLFTLTMPYLGYQSVTANYNADGGASAETLNQETELIDDIQKNGIVFGVSILRKLVPGWYIKGDIGNDQVAVGLTLEF